MKFLKKIVNKIKNPSEEDSFSEKDFLGEVLKHADLDYKFAQLFTKSGGFFNYCGDESEALQILNHIIKIENISSVFCFDSQLTPLLDMINTSHTEELNSTNDTAFITCEYLIAYDGKIMLSYNNIRLYQSSNLPEKIIVMGRVSQIVNNLTDAMGKIKRKGPIKNLTSISGSKSGLDMSTPKNTKLFLLLLED